MSEKISVIVPIFNVERFLPECVESLLAQTYQNLEIILVNDGSTDNSAQICAEFAQKSDKIKFINQENSGTSLARLNGIKAASGEFLAFCDPDDWVEAEMIEVLHREMKSNAADIVVCDYNRCGEQTKAIHQNIDNSLPMNEICDQFLSDKFPSYFWNKLFVKRIFDDLEFPGLKVPFEDLFIHAQLICRCKKLHYTPQILYNYRVHGSWATTSEKTRSKFGLFLAWREREKVSRIRGLKSHEFCLQRAQESAIALLTINSATKYLPNDEILKIEQFLKERNLSVNLSFKYKFEWWIYQNARFLAPILGNFSIFGQKLKLKF